MTIEEYQYYSQVAIKIFNYMNGNINKMNNNCKLCIDMHDSINGTYATIRYPNFIFLHLGTIIDSWNYEWEDYINRNSYIVSVISWALSHELHHADQLISMLQYNKNQAYKNSIEGDVERASYDWVENHQWEIYNLINIPLCISALDSSNLPSVGNYQKASASQFYKQTIANIIIRDMNVYNNLKCLIDDNLCDTISVNFNNTDSIIIKRNGNYITENIPAFSNLAYKYAGYYDRYYIVASEDIDGKSAVINFIITNSYIYPMIFK